MSFKPKNINKNPHFCISLQDLRIVTAIIKTNKKTFVDKSPSKPQIGNKISFGIVIFYLLNGLKMGLV